jgi:TIR domain-containing protein
MNDIFICHASEDKEAVVRPLAKGFRANGISCWIDEAEISWGDSIVGKVNEGLAKSKFVLVVLSQKFLEKHWPQHELNAALNDEASSGEVKVLPLIVGDGPGRKEILAQLPLLRGKLFLVWEGVPDQIVSELQKRLSRFSKSNLTGAIPDSLVSVRQQVHIPKLKKRFTDIDKDRFLKLSFDTMKSYFKDALSQLESHYPEIKTDFTEVHNLKFMCKVYMHGDIKQQCKIWIGGLFDQDSIAYSAGESLFLRKLVLGIPAQASGKNLTRPLMPSAPRPSCVRAAPPHHRKLGAGYAALPQMTRRGFSYAYFVSPLALSHDG